MNAPGTLLPYLIAAFLIYLYLPHILFKQGSEKWIDLGRKKDSSQLEEFLSAAMPCLVLNFVASICIIIPRVVFEALRLVGTSGVLRTVGDYLETFGTWPPGHVDWSVVAALVSPPASAPNVALRTYVSRGAWYGEISYAIWLYSLAAFNGRMYGRICRARIERNVTNRHLGAITRGMSRWERFRWYLGGVFFKLWNPFYHEFHVPFFRWVVHRNYVSVRTQDGRIFWGRVDRYDRTTDGTGIEGLTLRGVVRYVHDAKPPTFARFNGSFYIRWEHVVDINVTTMKALRRERARVLNSTTKTVESPRTRYRRVVSRMRNTPP